MKNSFLIYEFLQVAISRKRYSIPIILAITLIALCSCNNSNKKNDNGFAEIAAAAQTNKVYTETAQAGGILRELHARGLLPGVSKDEHGDLTSETVQLVISN